jgi:hypothetical protein
MTRQDFLAVYEEHQPNAWTRFAFKYFSQETTSDDDWVRDWAVISLGACFVLGLLFVISGKEDLAKIPTLIFAVGLFSIVILMAGGKIMNNLRIKKIAKELGISIGEYNHYANLYL